MNEIITCTDVTVHNEKTLALENVSFSVYAGEFLSIVGENGAGKSTLVKTILGIQKPDGGKIETAPGVTGKIGYLPQQSSAQRHFPASVREVVLSGCIGSTGIFPFYTRAHKARAAENMRLLGIGALASKNYRAYRAASSNACCWHGHSARPSACCSSTSRRRDLIRSSRPNSMRRSCTYAANTA